MAKVLNFSRLPSAAVIEAAEAQGDTLRDLSARIDAVSWNVDAALSAIGKDQAGYRRKNAANEHGGDNYTPGELEAATVRARELLRLLEPAAAYLRTFDTEGLEPAALAG